MVKEKARLNFWLEYDLDTNIVKSINAGQNAGQSMVSICRTNGKIQYWVARAGC